MIIKSIALDRKQIVKELCKRLNVDSEYLGAPSFEYQVGDYRVQKNGDVQVEDEKVNLDLIRELVAAELLQDPEAIEEPEVTISIPLEGHTVRSIINLLHTFCSREKLINRSLGCSHAFCMNKEFVDSLDKEEPESVSEILKRMEDTGGLDINRGLLFDEDKITFTGFPGTKDKDLVNTYLQFVSLINKMVMEQRRVSKDRSDTENEKYAFRVWLINLGMIGDEYKTARKILLKNMPGNSSFKTPDQAAAFSEKMKAKREEERKCSEYLPL